MVLIYDEIDDFLKVKTTNGLVVVTESVIVLWISILWIFLFDISRIFCRNVCKINEKFFYLLEVPERSLNGSGYIYIIYTRSLFYM